MAVQRTSFEKLQRDRAKKAKAAAKREKRLDKTEAPAEDEAIDLGAEGETLSAAELLVQIERIHKQFDDGDLSFEDFEELKTDLLARLPID